jgi:PP-loop superfamily ATP-utilizing enzyme
MRAITDAIKPLGFRWVCLDLQGYRMGSLNEALADQRGTRSPGVES